MRPARGITTADTDSLQADVMRFLAIIAFVLIAVLSLVENLAPAPAELSKVEQLPAPMPAAAAQPTTAVPPTETLPAAEPVAAEASQEDDKVAASAPEPALVLRFSSDKAFLFLLGQGEISLFGRQGASFRQLTPGFELIDSTLTGNLYEVTPTSLPHVVRRVFARTNDRDPGSETYLVALPADIHQQIARLQTRYSERSGTLTINRGGEVHYEDT